MTENELLCLYAVLSALVCLTVALVELIHRYSHASKTSAILFNVPAGIYLGVNFSVGFLAALGAHSSGGLTFDLSTHAVKIPDLFKAIFAGGVGLSLLRSSLATFKRDETENNVGFVAILDKLNEVLDRKINLSQKVLVDKEINAIMACVDPAKARHELPALCLAGINSCTERDVADMTDAINKLFMSDAVVVRPLLMGHALYQFCGLSVLQSAVLQLGDAIKVDEGNQAIDVESTQIAEELARELNRLKER